MTRDSKEKFCSITQHKMVKIFSAIVLNKFEVDYFLCKDCGIIQTESPYWLTDAYNNPISNLDIGILSRNIYNSNRLEPILDMLFHRDDKFLDLGGGYGILTRLLRDKGFDCFTIDKYCQNLFAIEFEPSDNFIANSLFAFEVFEHIENPYFFLEESFQKYSCKTIIFSTLLFKSTPPRKDWWYYAFDTGQHISFYQNRTLECIARKLHCKYISLSDDLHIITDQDISNLKIFFIKNKILFKLITTIIRIKRRKLSKRDEDFTMLSSQ